MAVVEERPARSPSSTYRVGRGSFKGVCGCGSLRAWGNGRGWTRPKTAVWFMPVLLCGARECHFSQIRAAAPEASSSGAPPIEICHKTSKLNICDETWTYRGPKPRQNDANLHNSDVLWRIFVDGEESYKLLSMTSSRGALVTNEIIGLTLWPLTSWQRMTSGGAQSQYKPFLGFWQCSFLDTSGTEDPFGGNVWHHVYWLFD